MSGRTDMPAGKQKVVMSERKIGDGQGNDIIEYAVCANACTGAPATIQPGSVVAMAESLERCLEVLEFREAMSPECKAARAALAMYNGGE